ncbi:hypothetical protein D9M68_94180 [compost metagenome]
MARVAQNKKPQAEARGAKNGGNTRLQTLPHTGRGRWSDIAPFVGVCRETWRQLVNAGKAPAPLHLTGRCALYDFASIHKWIADPVSYQAGGNQ